MTIEIVRSPAGLANVRKDWDALLELTPEASGFQSHAWITTWLDRAAQRSQELQVAVVKADGRAIAIFPMQLSSRGHLGFIGADVGNYSGPVFDPARLVAAVRAWAEHTRDDRRIKGIDLQGLRARSPFFRLIREQGLPGLGRPLLVRTDTCPEVDLRDGWSTLLERHKSRQRATWRRKRDRLARLGALEFIETGDADAITEAMPKLAELWETRWRGQRIRASFVETPELQLRAAQALAPDLMLLSMLRLDGEIIAFSYGVRGRDYTSSYVLAHDHRFNRYSPGLLLLLHVLEAACERGDRLYDFSLGEAPYKALWDTGEHDVYRAVWGHGRHAKAAWSAAWVQARSIGWLRAVKLGGYKSAIRRAAGRMQTSHRTDTPAEVPRETFIYRVNRESGSAVLRRCSYREMSALLSPRVVSLALERNFRGDVLLIVEAGAETLGVVWLAAANRRRMLVGDDLYTSADEVYYHPIALPCHRLETVIEQLAGGNLRRLVVTDATVSTASVTACGSRVPDSAVWPKEGSETL